MSLIVDVEAIPLRAALDSGDLDSSGETIVVRLTDEDGRTGIGETDAPALAVRELVLMHDIHAWSRGLRGLLLGRDPFEREALWHELAAATIYHGRRGLGVHALSAVDVALHDLAGKQLGRPVYQLLGGARQDRIRPYATLWPGAVGERTLGQMMEAIGVLCERALAAGFRAVKMEVFFGDLVSDRELAACIREGRKLVGDGVTFMVDFGYRWSDWRDALPVLAAIEECDVFLAEATLRHDDLAGHAKLAARSPIRIAGAEMAATADECREWLERGNVDVLQPDVNRCGGLTELKRIAELAAWASAIVVPHHWKTGISAAASGHFQAATPNVPFVELLSPVVFDSPLRAELTRPEPVLEDGTLPLPTSPGLGVELVDEAVGRYAVEG